MNKQEEQEYRWNLLIELELYPLLECARNALERETFLTEYCETNKIPLQFARNKIARIKQLKEKAKQETVEYDER